ncbi:MAG TPA: hypothetical protein PK664_04590 [Paludibacteraceae bacterium]|nr:hypothetical protein [Paludibacteraceae bacterium]
METMKAKQLTDKIPLTKELKVLLLQVLKAKEMTKDQADKLVKILTDAELIERIMRITIVSDWKPEDERF